MINHPVLLKELGVDRLWLSRHQSLANQPAVNEIEETSMVSEERPFDNKDMLYIQQVENSVVSTVLQDQTAADTQSIVPEVQPIDVSSMNWSQLAETVSQCQQCQLCTERTHTVFGVGDQQANWMFVGEGPGRNEDLQGEPFVGKAGQLLDNMIKAMGVRRGDNVYIANIIKCRPTDQNGKDRRPSQEEVDACIGYVKRQIALVNPTVIVALGHTAAWALLGVDPSNSVGKLRGKVHQYMDKPVIVTYHPSYLLRQPQDKGLAWKDLCLAMQTYAEHMQS